MYALLDSGHGEKLEQFGELTLIRPCAQAIWRPTQSRWHAHARFSRESGNQWEEFESMPETWIIELEGVRFKLKRTQFGHLGIFPEHAQLWEWMTQQIQPGDRLLNLFAYSGGATLAAAKAGAKVSHLDAAKGMVSWARENADLNQLEARWIVDDVRKYLTRALKRGERYEGIILDPPTFGRGKSLELFKIERDLPRILDQCVELQPKFVILSCHTPGYTPLLLKQLLEERWKGEFDADELILGRSSFDKSPVKLIPTGAFARWRSRA